MAEERPTSIAKETHLDSYEENSLDRTRELASEFNAQANGEDRAAASEGSAKEESATSDREQSSELTADEQRDALTEKYVRDALERDDMAECRSSYIEDANDYADDLSR